MFLKKEFKEEEEEEELEGTDPEAFEEFTRKRPHPEDDDDVKEDDDAMTMKTL